MSEKILIDHQEIYFDTFSLQTPSIPCHTPPSSLFPFLPHPLPHSSKEGAVICKVVSVIKCAIASRQAIFKGGWQHNLLH